MFLGLRKASPSSHQTPNRNIFESLNQETYNIKEDLANINSVQQLTDMVLEKQRNNFSLKRYN